LAGLHEGMCMKEIQDELKAVPDHFTTVFNDLEWDKFVECFSDDASGY
jgi:hypothetical protein